MNNHNKKRGGGEVVNVLDENKRLFFGKQFSKLLKKWEEDNNKTQKDFCISAGVSKNIVTAWKKGRRFPRDAQLDKIAEVFGVDARIFLPVLPFEIDRVTNSITQERSNELQRYADQKGLDNNFYEYITKKKWFLKKFPFHKRGDWFWNNELVQEKQRGELVKYQFEDDKGHRVMMTEEDIDFVIRLQEKTDYQIDYLMYRERESIQREWIRKTIQQYTTHMDLDRADIEKRICTLDLTDENTPITEKLIARVCAEFAKEKGIKPRYTMEEIIKEHQDFVDAMKTDDDLMRRMNRIHGVTEEELHKMDAERENQFRQFLKEKIERYRKLGWLVEDKEEKRDGVRSGKEE